MTLSESPSKRHGATPPRDHTPRRNPAPPKAGLARRPPESSPSSPGRSSSASDHRPSRLPAGTSRSRAAVRRLAAGLVLVVAALAADPAAAQTSITLVSNTGQTDGGSGTLRDLDHAQAFTTGGNSAGYTLTGVDIEFNAVASATASYDVSIQTDNSGSPGTSLGDLTGPATLVANAVNAYTTAGIALAANTTYFVLVDSSSTVINRLQNTTSDNEDSGGQSDWSIADGSVYRNRDNTGGWTDFDESKKIAIKGYAKDTLVSNTGQGNAGVINVSSNEFAQAFGTGSHTAGYDLDSIVLSLGFAPTGTGTLTVTVRADASGDPSGTALHTLTTPDPIAENVLNTFNAPAGATLDADITYWVVASYSSDSGGPNLWRTLLSNGIDSGGAAGWTIDSPYKEDDRTDPAGWEEGASDRALKLQVKGTAKGGPTLSTDATLSALALSGVTLAPAFVSSTETYTATVVNSVMQTTVTATPTHSGATVAFKDGDDTALTNPVTLDVGANVIKAVVTAEDTTTMKTYMVTVTREGTTDTLVTIEAEHESIGAGLEDLVFTLTRAGATTDALPVKVTITQAQTWLGNSDLEHDVTFSANSATAELTITASNFSFTPSTTGYLTATVSGDDIDGGSDTVQIISTSGPPITISYEESAYTFAEEATDEAINVLATLDAAYPRGPGPSISVPIAFSSRSGTAVSPEDFAAITWNPNFLRSDFERDVETDPLVARKAVPGFAIVNDDIYEGSESFEMTMEFAPGLSADLVQFANPDGTTCIGFTCAPKYPVTITDEGDLPELSLSVDPPSIAEEDDDGTTSVAENVSTVTVGTTNGKTFAVDKTATLTFSGTATQGTHYSVSPGDADSGTGGHQVVLPKETASVEVTVTAVGNDTANGPRTVTVKGTLGAKDIGTEDITILDDEATTSTCLTPTFTGRAEVWRGTITVGNDAFSRGYEDNNFGDLSDPDNFDYGGNNYTIAGIRESFDTGSVNRLELDLDVFLPDSDRANLRLHLCDDTFDLTAASKVNATKTYRWSDAVLDWSGATTIEAALSGSPPAIVTDGVEVTSTAATANTYGLGETIEITVTFDTAVTVDTTGGTPRIRSVLNGGGTPVDGWAEYSRGSGGTALVFTYTVQAGDKDDDGIWLPANSLELQSGTIRDAAYPTVAATLTYAQPGTQSEHKVDGGPTTSDDATLSALALSGVTLAPTFVSATEDYTATVGNSVTETTVTATPTHSGATVAFKDGDDNALTNPVTLAVGANVIKAVVTAEDTTTMKTYMVTVTREATTTAPAIVTNGVQVTSTPMATADTYGLGETIAITVTFDNPVTVDTSGGTPRIQFRLGPPRDDKWAEYGSGSGGTALVFTYMVQAGDRDVVDGIWLPENELQLQSGTIRDATDNTVAATLTYTQPGPQSGHKVDGSLTTTDATLSALALSGVTLAPTFVSSTETYTATVGNAVMETTVTAPPTHSGATVAFKDGADNALTNPVTLAVGANVIKAVVTAEDTTTMKTYTVTVTRGATPVPAIVAGGVRVTSTPMAMDGADTYYGRGETIKITVTFDNAVTVDTSGGTPRIAFHLDGFLFRWAEYSSGSGGTALVFTYTVQAGDRDEDGIWLEENLLELQSGTIRATADHTNTVDATLTYADPGLQSGHKVDGSLTTADATLSALALSGVTLAPTFVSSTETYTATVANTVTQTTVTATPTHSGATVAFQDGNGNPLTNPVDLAVGANVIKAVVTAEDGTTTKTYMVTVTLAPAIVTDGVQVTSTPATGNTYGRDETIEITVTFDNAVMVGGTPRIAFHLDGGLRWAEYRRGSGGTALVFTYTVLADDRAVNGILLAADEVELFGGTILAAADPTVEASLTYAEPGLQSGHKVNGSLTTTTDDDDDDDGTTTTPPAIVTDGVQVTSTPMATGDTYGRGETIAITVTFDNAVTVDTSGGTRRPGIAFHLDGDPNPNRWAVYHSSGSGGTALVFTYTVLADDMDADGIRLPANKLELFSATIRDATDTSVDATLTYTQPGLQSGHKVDGSLTTTTATTPPAIDTDGVQVTSTPATGDTYRLGETIAITVTFDKAVTVDTSGGTRRPGIAFRLDGDLLRWAVYSSGSGGTALVFTYTVLADDMAADGIWLLANKLELFNGTIRAAADPTVDASLTYAEPGLQSGHKVKGSLATTIDDDDEITSPPTVTGGGGGGGGGSRGRPPSYPGTIRAEDGDGEATLTWDAPSSQGSSRIQYYEYRIDGEGEWISTGSADRAHTITGLINGRIYFFHLRAVSAAGGGAHRISPEAMPVADLDFTHFANGGFITSTLALVNAGAYPVRPAIYFYDQDGEPIAARSLVSLTPELEVRDDGALSPRTVMNPLGELTIATHGRGGQRVGSVSVRAPSSIGGVLRFDIPNLGVAGVGDSATLRDALVPVRRQDDGINTGVAVRNRGTAALTLQCRLMRDGAVLEETIIPLAANGQDSRFIDQVFPTADTSDFVGSVRCTAPEPGRFSAVAFELDGVHRIFTTLPVVPVPAVPDQEQEQEEEQDREQEEEPEQDTTRLDFTHFANGGDMVSDLVLVNPGADPIRPAIYFYDQQGDPIAAESLVDINEDLEIGDDGALSPRKAINPLGELTISTHGRGGQVVGSAAVMAEGPIGGVLRFDIPGLGVAGVGDSAPVRDAMVPVRRQADGINTGVAVHNRGATALLVRCRLMRDGAVLEETMIPLTANGQDSRFIDQVFPTADTSDFVGSVRCLTPEPGRFSAVAFELDGVHRIFTTLPVVPVVEVP